MLRLSVFVVLFWMLVRAYPHVLDSRVAPPLKVR